MTVLTFLPRFAPLVKAGTKLRTIRAPRKRPIKVGDNLSLRQWSGKPYGKGTTQIVLRESACARVRMIHITTENIALEDAYGEVWTQDIKDRDQFSRLDGFTDWNDMVEYFTKARGLPFSGVLIEWEL